MIEPDRITELVDLANPLPEASRVALLESLTHLSLEPAAWYRAMPLIRSLSGSGEVLDALARVPLLSVRSHLRERLTHNDDETSLRLASGLALQRDGAAVQRLMREFTRAPSAAVARALACVLKPDQGVATEDLRAGLDAADEMTRLWTTIAITRVKRRDGRAADLEPLEQLWDACVRSDAAATPAAPPPFAHPPLLFHGDPVHAAAELAVVRPLPETVVRFLIGLKDNDFDGWLPRQHDISDQTYAARALIAGLTGRFNVDGEPAKGSDLLPPPQLSVTGLAPLFTPRLRALAATAAQRPGLPAWPLGNAVVELAHALSPHESIEIAPLLDDAELLRQVPRRSLAWSFARLGPDQVLGQFTRIIGRQPEAARASAIDWLRDTAAEFDAPPPFEGSGAAAAVPAPPAELIDDRTAVGGAAPRTRARRSAPSRRLAPPEAQPKAQTEAKASIAPSGEPSFHFLLQGDDARGDAIVAHCRAKLEFRFEQPPPEVLAVVTNEALERAREADRDIVLQLTTRGSLTLTSGRYGVACMRQGAMQAPVVFELEAGADDEVGSGATVDFIVQGDVVHQLDLTIVVVPDRDGLSARARRRCEGPRLGPKLLDDAAGAAPPPPQRMHLTLSLDAQGFRIDLMHWADGPPKILGPYVVPTIDAARLETLVVSLRKGLEGCFRGPLWPQFDGVIPNGPEGNLARAQLPRLCSLVAQVGAELNDSLREWPALAQALDHIEALPDGSTLTISTDSVYLPWEILYPRPWRIGFSPVQIALSPLDVRLFWGARFAIETVQASQPGPQGGSIVDLRNRHLARPPSVSINLNPAIDTTALPPEQQPLEVQRAWANALEGQGKLQGLQDECGAMRHVLQDAATNASLVYVYCHGSAEQPFGGSSELLVLASGCEIRPMDLLVGEAFPGAPIVFLNACESATHSPLAFASFLKAFRRRGALGMIAASFAVPAVFGAHFGTEVAQCVLARTGSLASALLELRLRHLRDSGNPVPLFYALQCQITYPAKEAP